MTTAHELFRAGKLSEAIAAVTEVVKKQPTDLVSRGRLCEYLCFAGELERADKQLDAAGQLDPKAAIGVNLLRHLIRSEMCRREVYTAGRVPEFTETPTENQQRRLHATICVRNGEFKEAARLVAEACDHEQECAFEVNGKAINGFRDLDDLLGPNLEVYTATGKYYWIGIEQIQTLEFSPPDCLSDHLWRAATIETASDISGRIHVPVLYFGSHAAEDPGARTGRATDWKSSGDGAIVQGLGQREFLAGEEPMLIMDITRLQNVTP
jgi:type VI secretion system protein ImpE